MIRLASPFMLAALLVLPLVLLSTRRRTPRRHLLGLRLVALVALALAAAGLELMAVVPDITVVLVADRSDSIGPEGARAIRAFLDGVRAVAGPHHRVGLVTFGGDAVLEEAPSPQPRLALTSRPRADGTNLALAIERALTAVPEGRRARIVLLTDGNATTGNLPQALDAARARGVELAVVPVASASGPDVLVEDVSVPSVVSLGERIPVRVTLRATAPAEATLRVRGNGTLLLVRDLQLRPGRTEVDLEPVTTQGGLLRVDAAVDADPDGEPGNNRAFALAFVQGRPFVLYAGDPPGPLADVLAGQGFEVRRTAPGQLPTSPAAYQGVAAVVLDDLPAYRLSPHQMTALRDYVAAGGGLVAAAGRQSFGIGGYADTPLEEALPVSMDVRHRLAIPSMAVVLVLDASGSMGSFGPELAKVELAKETAQSVIDLLGERDLVGVIAFDQQPRWLVELTPAGRRAAILDAVARIKAGGGTNLYPALVAARDALRRAEAKVKHVIVLSDGQTDPGDFRGLTVGMADERMTVSTVAIGRDADVEIMRNIAAWGRGRAYVAQDLYSIPQILTAEAMLATRAYVVEERFSPRIVGAPAPLAGIAGLPPLRGYLATAPKPAAEVAVISHQDDPVVALWAYGLGRAVAVATDARLRWTAEWSGWPDAPRFWSQLVRWASATASWPLDVHVDTEAGRVRVVLDARAADGTPIVSWTAQAAVAGDGAETVRVPLEQTQPGWYEASLPLPAPGAYLVTVAAYDGGRLVGRAARGLAVPYSPELRQVGLNRALLSQIVETAAARIVTRPAEALASPAHPERRPRPVWPALAAVGLMAFLAEVTLRRVPVIEHHVARLAAAAVALVRRTPPPDVLAGDAEYDAADRWRIDEPAEAAARAASMEAAARLYIARLRRQREDDQPA
ncbi:MAG: VWA domain-containing protein [Armatimonadota bacterium]|nr:VWA domain-containing protein [Armatimonadota bacterium]